MSYLRFTALLLVFLCIAGCKKTVISSFNINEYNHVIVTADNGYTLTMPQIFELLQKSSLVTNGGTLSPTEVKDFIDSIVVDSMAGFRADEIDISTDYQRYRLMKRRFNESLFRMYLKEVIYDKVELDSVEIEKYYYDHPELYSKPEQVLLHHILITSTGLKNSEDSLYYRSLTPDKLEEETSAYAAKIWNILEDGEAFADVAARYSHDNFAETKSGFIGWTEKGLYKHPFDSIAFSMQPGAYSKPYKDADNWHIIYIEDKKEEGFLPFDSLAYQDAYQRLFSIKADSLAVPLIDSLDNEINLEYNEPLLDSSVYMVDLPEWVAVLNGVDTIENADLRGLEESFRNKYNVKETTRDMKKEMINRVAKNLIILQAAHSLMIDTLPQVIDYKNELAHNTGKSMVMSQGRGNSWNPTDEIIEKYFNDHINDYKIDKPLVVQQIITDDSSFAEFLRDQALAGVDFLELAQEYYPGEESIRKELANLGAIGPEDVDPYFYNAAMITPVNSVSRPIKTKYGYQIIKVLEKYDKPSVDKARTEIVKILTENHVREVFKNFRDDLYRSYNVKFPGRIKPVHLRPLKVRLGN
ncbi:MAG: peptidylprolyl isomerase [bacterium]